MSSTVPPPLGPLHHPGRPEVEVEIEVEVEVEVEAGAAAGCHPEEVAGVTTMEARPGAAVVVAAVEEGAVVAVAVGVAVARPLDDERV